MIPFSGLDKSWASALSLLHKTDTFKSQTWLSPIGSTEFTEILCALYERHAVKGTSSLEFSVGGTSIYSVDDISDLEVHLGPYEAKIELVEQVHEAILDLADVFYDYDMTPITEAEILAEGVTPEEYTFPDSMRAAERVLRRMSYSLLNVLAVDTEVVFYPYTRDEFIYADWPLPRVTGAGFPIEGYQLTDESSDFGQFLLTDKDKNRFQNRVKLSLTKAPAPDCAWVYTHIKGGTKLLSLTDRDLGDNPDVIEVLFPRYPEDLDKCKPFPSEWLVDLPQALNTRVLEPALPDVPLSAKRIKFTVTKYKGCTYFLLNRARMDQQDSDRAFAYKANVVRISINNYTLPPLPVTPVDVTDYLSEEGSNVLEILVEDGQEFAWTDIYLLEGLQLDTFIPPPVYLEFMDGCYEGVESAPATTENEPYYPYSVDNGKCWRYPALMDTVKFDVLGLVNPQFNCLPEPPRHAQSETTTGLVARALYADQQFVLEFTQDVGIPYSVVFEYMSVIRLERSYEVAAGTTVGEITSLLLQAPVDAEWYVRVLITFDGAEDLTAAFSTWGLRQGQWIDVRDISDNEDIFDTLF